MLWPEMLEVNEAVAVTGSPTAGDVIGFARTGDTMPRQANAATQFRMIAIFSPS